MDTKPEKKIESRLEYLFFTQIIGLCVCLKSFIHSFIHTWNIVQLGTFGWWCWWTAAIGPIDPQKKRERMKMSTVVSIRKGCKVESSVCVCVCALSVWVSESRPNWKEHENYIRQPRWGGQWMKAERESIAIVNPIPIGQNRVLFHPQKREKDYGQPVDDRIGKLQ